MSTLSWIASTASRRRSLAPNVYCERVRSLCGHVSQRCDRLASSCRRRVCVRSESYPSGSTEDRDWSRCGSGETRGETETISSLCARVYSTQTGRGGRLPRLVRQGEAARRAPRRQRPSSGAWRWRPTSPSVLGSIRVSTLVLHRDQGREQARYVADPSLTRRSSNSAARGAGCTQTMSPMRCSRSGGAKRSRWVSDSSLSTVLFTDLVGSTEQAAELGNRECEASSRSTTPMFAVSWLVIAGSRWTRPETASSADSTGPARAIACAQAILEGAKRRGLEVRAGIHTGECELVGEKIAGISVVTGLSYLVHCRNRRGPRVENGQRPRRRVWLCLR